MRLLVLTLILAGFVAAATATVELTSFVAIPGDARATFTWSTARETGNFFFEFVRNGDRMPQTTGHGTTSEPHDYLWIDSTLVNDSIYFYTFYAQGTSGRDSLAAAVIAPPHWVALADLRAVVEGGRVSVLWTTYSEIGHDQFEIVRDGAVVATAEANNRYSGTYYYVWIDSVADPEQPHTYELWAVAADERRDSLRSVISSSSAAEPEAALLPQRWELAAYPNPFNPVTTLALSVPRAGHVSLAVYDILGRETAVLLDRFLPAGAHAVAFDGAGLPSGLYFARLESAGISVTQKLLLAK